MKLLSRMKEARGFTVVEIIIALTICMILVGGLSSVSRMAQQIFNNNRGVITNQQNAYFAMEMMLRDLRAATTIMVNGTNLLTFTDADGNIITYALVENALQRTQTTVDPVTGSHGTPQTETLATQVTTFNITYFDILEAPPATANNVARIQFDMRATTATGTQVRLFNSVRPRNL